MAESPSRATFLSASTRTSRPWPQSWAASSASFKAIRSTSFQPSTYSDPYHHHYQASPGSNVWQSYYAPIYSPPGRILALVSRWGLEPHIGRAEGWQPHHPPPSPISPIAPPFGAGFLPRLPSQVIIFFYLEEKLLLSIASSIVQLQQLRGLGRLAAHLPPSSSSTCRRRRRSGGSSLSSSTLSNATLTLFGSL